jgi:hypothetical protein
MSAEFRVIHFISDPFLGARIPVAALLREDDDVVRLIRAQHLPGAECLGGAEYSAALRMVLECLDSSPTFDQLPLTVGPLAIMAEPVRVPDAIRDPVKWLQQVLPTTPKTEQGREREANRSTVGYKFFQSWQINHYVQKHFRMSAHWQSLSVRKSAVTPSAASTDSISHWVEGTKKVLLMEPLIPSRRSFSNDVHEVAQNFSAYRFHLSELRPEKDVLLVAYVLPYANQERREEAFISLKKVAHRVIDLSNKESERNFVQQVESVGKSGARMLDL